MRGVSWLCKERLKEGTRRTRLRQPPSSKALWRSGKHYGEASDTKESTPQPAATAFYLIHWLSAPGVTYSSRLNRSSVNIMSKTVLMAVLGLALMGPGCSIKRLAVNQVGNALAGGGSTFASDDDPELVKAAAPFSLKLMETLLAENPRHEGLLLASASGFTQYAYAFVQQDADEMEEKDFAAAEQMKVRARRLYLRARNYGLRGL